MKKKYREYWLTGQYPNIMFALSHKPDDDVIHVIEYAAYDAVVRAHDDVVLTCKALQKVCAEIEPEMSKLTARCEKAEVFREAADRGFEKLDAKYQKLAAQNEVLRAGMDAIGIIVMPDRDGHHRRTAAKEVGGVYWDTMGALTEALGKQGDSD